jgi:alpha-ketoglutarate-dependent 2,4-dichlorophenoxyacetate dioxygenase
MALDMRPLHSSFGVEIVGIDVRRIDDAVFREVARALDDHSVLLFPRQSLTDEEQIAFSERFGPLETTIRTIASQARDLPEISNLSNVDTEDRLIPRGDKRNLFNAGNQMWHSDSSFKRVPAMASLLSAREVPPEGGETQFASMRVGYEGLSEAMKQRLEGRVAIHSFVYSRALLRELLVAATRPELIYTHRWAPGDLVMWDNRAVLHRGRPWDESRYRRVMHRTTVAGIGPTAADVRDVTVSAAREPDVAWGRAQLEAV